MSSSPSQSSSIVEDSVDESSTSTTLFFRVVSVRDFLIDVVAAGAVASIFSTSLGKTEPRTTYATPRSGGTVQLDEKMNDGIGEDDDNGEAMLIGRT
mmetsp:Transcript_59827/g.146927  ORF Transcript_59827/g.146927 Transcript_59827/m.146927 type:complete len:97 (-) Transcript_59827:196-486(-)